MTVTFVIASRVIAGVATAGLIALGQCGGGNGDDKPTPRPSVLCDSNDNGLVWCYVPAPTATPEGIEK